MHLLKRIFLLVTVIVSNTNYAQQQEDWLRCYNQDSTLIGYKNQKGNIKLAPQFNGMGGWTHAEKFSHIITASKSLGKETQRFYITKEKKIIGRDSLYTFDNTADCEREGHIRFRDPVTQLVGMFDKDGNIAIPAKYSMLQPVTNNVAVALYGASKKYYGDKHNKGCNHYSWQGGTVYLLDTHGNILVENFEYEYETNLFSLQVTKEHPTEPLRKEYLGKNGMYYSVINYEEEFTQWIQKHLFESLTLEKIKAVSYPEITLWVPEERWVETPKSQFLKNNFIDIKQLILLAKEKQADYFVTMDGLNSFMYESKRYEKYFDNCGQARREQYPVLQLIINQKVAKETDQKSLSFLRTDQGYQLLNVSID